MACPRSHRGAGLVADVTDGRWGYCASDAGRQPPTWPHPGQVAGVGGERRRPNRGPPFPPQTTRVILWCLGSKRLPTSGQPPQLFNLRTSQKKLSRTHLAKTEIRPPHPPSTCWEARACPGLHPRPSCLLRGQPRLPIPSLFLSFFTALPAA